MRQIHRRSLVAAAAVALAALPLSVAAAPPGVIATAHGDGRLRISGDGVDQDDVIVVARYALRTRVHADGSAEGGLTVRGSSLGVLDGLSNTVMLACRIVAGNLIGTDRLRLTGSGAAQQTDGTWRPLGACVIDVWEHAYSNACLDDRISIEFTGAGITLESSTGDILVKVAN